MSSHAMEGFTCLIIALLLFGFFGSVFGQDYYSTSTYWGFQNYCYLGFNQAMNFTYVPHQGVFYDESLVGYWNMDEGIGSVMQDGSGNNNNGTLVNSPAWVTGKFGNATSLFSSQNIQIPYSEKFDNFTEFSISAWIYPTAWGTYNYIINKGWQSQGAFVLHFASSGILYFTLRDSTGQKGANSGTRLSLNQWYHVLGTYQRNTTNGVKLYVNAVQHLGSNTLDEALNNNNSIQISNTGNPFNGIIDDVRIYNRALSAMEVATLYSQPDPATFANYYSFTDPLTKNTMLIHIDTSNVNVKNDNSALVTCTNFFEGNSLAFAANNSAIVNVWTNLGQPIFTTGVWNSQNCTTTLTLDASSTGEIKWSTYNNITTYADTHCSVSPSNVTVAYGANQTLNFNATQGYGFNVSVDGVSQGQIGNYTFHNVTAPHTVNVASTKLTYKITASADAHSAITPGNVSVSYGENQPFNITAESGYYISHVYVDGEDQGNITSYNFTNVQSNHTISVSSATIAPTNGSTPTPSPTPSPSTSPTSSPTPSQTPQPTNSPFPTEAALIAVVAIVIIVALFALALKKGYITIEVVKESPED